MAVQPGVSYSVENDVAFRNALDRARQAIDDFRIPFGLISKDFYKSQRAIFQLKGPGQYPDFQGERGEDGMTPYMRRKQRKFGFTYPLLVATGALAASTLTPNARGSINIITKFSLVLGTQIPYGIYHQSDAPRKKLPQRKFFFIGPEAKKVATSEQMGRLERWLNMLNDYVTKKLKAESAR